MNMGVVLPQAERENGYGRGLTKGGGKLGWPAFFSFKAVTTQKGKKRTGSVRAGSVRLLTGRASLDLMLLQ